jgi:hypothetical protein
MITLDPIAGQCPEGLLLAAQPGTEAGADAAPAPALEQSETPSPPGKRGGGPKSEVGKRASRANSLRFGLMARSVFPPNLQADIEACTAEMTEQFRPATPYETGLVAEMGRATAQLRLCEELKVIDFQRGIDRAVLCWDEDRRDHVHALGARLARDPARVSEALRRTRQGTDWCVERWEGLAEAVEVRGEWTDEQRRLAFDLLGVPLEFRATSRRVPAASEGAALAALAAREIARHGARLEGSLIDLDEAMQALAASGMPMEEDATTRSLRRSESMLRRARDKARAELLRVRAEAAASAPAGSPASTPTTTSPPAAPPPRERPILSEAAHEFQIQKIRASFDPARILEDRDNVPPLVVRPGFLPPRPMPRDAAAEQTMSAEERSRRERRLKRNREKQARKAARSRGR